MIVFSRVHRTGMVRKQRQYSRAQPQRHARFRDSPSDFLPFGICADSVDAICALKESCSMSWLHG